jgi:hypothetical protein
VELWPRHVKCYHVKPPFKDPDFRNESRAGRADTGDVAYRVSWAKGSLYTYIYQRDKTQSRYQRARLGSGRWPPGLLSSVHARVEAPCVRGRGAAMSGSDFPSRGSGLRGLGERPGRM